MKSIKLTAVIRRKKKRYIQSTPQITAENILNRNFVANNPFDTLDKAIESNPTATPLFHSDRGFQYTSKTFKYKLNEINAIQSMSRVGRGIDNGPMEAFWGTLKVEMYYLRKFDTFDELKQAIDDYIEFYNKKRLQKKLKGMAPIEYRSHTLAA